jgi:hypothetical protein
MVFGIRGPRVSTMIGRNSAVSLKPLLQLWKQRSVFLEFALSPLMKVVLVLVADCYVDHEDPFPVLYHEVGF